MTSTYFFKDGPIDDLIKFLPKSKDYKFKAFNKIYSAPSVLIKFSDIFKLINCLFFFKGIDSISAPFMPISLSSKSKVYKVLFCNKIAAKHRAPSIPNEFFLIDPSSIPKFNVFICVFLMNSYKISDKPTSLIILLDKFKFYIFVLLTMFLIACMPY